MVKHQAIARLQNATRTTLFWAQASVLMLVGLLPILASGQASAAQLSSRSATIDQSKVSATNVQFSFAYTAPTTGSALQGIVYNFCTTPLGACTLPTGMSVNTAAHVSQSGFPSNGTSFAARTGADLGACLSTSGTTYTRCFDRTQVATGGGALTHVLNNITAPSSKQTVYIRIALFSDTSFATLVDDGTVAVAFVDQLVTNGRVQERLDFCVAAITNAAALPGDLSTCSAINASTIDIGIIDNAGISVSPVAVTATNGSNDKYGVLMLNTNAAGGSVVSYFPEAAATGTNQLRSFRVTGASCNVSNATLTDQCFQDAAVGGTTFSIATENFGIQIPCIDTTQGTTAGLGSVPAAYSNTDATTTSSADCEDISAGDTGVKFAWNNSASATTLASSTGVVDDEIVKVRFGAAAAATTPTGAYTVTTNYIATPTF